MTTPLPLPDWVPWWVHLAVLLAGGLFVLLYLAMPFAVFGVKTRLEVIEARLDEIQAEIRSLSLRLPEQAGMEDAYTPTDRYAAARPPIPPAPHSPLPRSPVPAGRSRGFTDSARRALMRPHPPEAAPMRVSVLQMNPGADKAANIAQAAHLLDDAAADRPDLVTLPEMWTCLGGDAATKLAQSEPLPPPGSNQPGGPAYEWLRGAARSRGIHLHGGSMAEQAEGRLFNTTVVFDPQGAEVARYRKIHLFDITTPDGTAYGESKTYGGGGDVVTFDAGGVRVGLAICYDVRFPELFLALRRAGAELILLPSAFTVPTGRDHWEVLIRARAIETQCWMAAPATWGRHLDAKGEPRATFGHSLVCDPWGHVTANVPDGVGWATARVDPAATARIRRDMPVLDHRRLA